MQQRTRVYWLKNGDINSNFFHNMTSVRKKVNRTDIPRNEEGFWNETKIGIKNTVLNYFHNLFNNHEIAENVEEALQSGRPCVKEEESAWSR